MIFEAFRQSIVVDGHMAYCRQMKGAPQLISGYPEPAMDYVVGFEDFRLGDGNSLPPRGKQI